MRISDWSSDVCSSDLLVRIRWHLIDVAIGMDCELDARDASPRQIGGMSHAGEAGEDQHQACQERQKGSHEPALTTERFPCHCNNSRAGAFAARHAGQASPSTRHAERSEEHTSELQSQMRISYAVFCLKKKNSFLQPHNNNSKRHTYHVTLL